MRKASEPFEPRSTGLAAGRQFRFRRWRNPRLWRQLDMAHGELASRESDWSGAGFRDDRKQLLGAGASGQRARRSPVTATCSRCAGRGDCRPPIHEGMYWGAVGPRPPAPRGKERGITSPSARSPVTLLSPTQHKSIHRFTNQHWSADKHAKLQNVVERADHRLTPRALSGTCHVRASRGGRQPAKLAGKIRPK